MEISVFHKTKCSGTLQSYLKTFYDVQVENLLLQLKNMVLVERSQINKEQALLPQAAAP